MPKASTYKANSVIYFQGDVGDRIYILQSGTVSLNSNDIETGEEIHDQIKTGEFFGVKSALGKYPREENAVVLTDAAVVVFSVPEFEQLALSNTRIVMKMLKVFSNQLRRLHTKVSGLMQGGAQSSPEDGLFRIGEYYMRKKQYAQAVYAFNKYLTYYPSGRHQAEASRHAETAEQFAQKYGSGKGPAAPGFQGGSHGNGETDGGRNAGGAASGGGGQNLSDSAKAYYEAVSSFSREEFAKALEQFKQVAASGGDEEYVLKSTFEIGRCLFGLERYDAVIKHYTGLIQKFPKLPDLTEALFYLGRAYQESGDTARAASFFKKILSMEDVDEGLRRKVNKAVRALEGN